MFINWVYHWSLLCARVSHITIIISDVYWVYYWSLLCALVSYSTKISSDVYKLGLSLEFIVHPCLTQYRYLLGLRSLLGNNYCTIDLSRDNHWQYQTQTTLYPTSKCFLSRNLQNTSCMVSSHLVQR